MATPVVFKYGTRAQYDALQEKATNALYFLTDTGEIYRGDVGLARGSHFEGVFDPEIDTDDNSVIARVLGDAPLVKDDIFVVKRLIADDKYSYTSYVYDGAWKAMDGNYSASNVYLDSDITATTTVGTITELTNGAATFAVKGLSIQKALEKLLAQEKEPTITDPTYSLTATATTTSNEVGGYITALKWNGTWSAGSYEYGSKEDSSTSTGITATFAVSNNKNSDTATTEDGTFTLAENIQIDTTSAKTYATITGVATYEDSPYTPVTNLGSEAAEGAIEGSSISKTANVSVTGYRNVFYGVYDAKGSNGENSATIRDLTKSNAAPKTNTAYNIAIDATAKRAVFAYPATYKDLTEILDKNDSNANIVGAFTKSTVKVEGLNGFDAIDYKVYTINFKDEGYGQSNTFIVKIPA